MIEQVVNSILEAEDVAKQHIAKAEQQAGQIVAEAEQQSVMEKRNNAELAKQIFAQQMQQAQVDADNASAESLCQLKQQADQQIAAYKGNVDGAVKIILESL